VTVSDGGFWADSNWASRLRQIYILSSNARVYDRSADLFIFLAVSLSVNTIERKWVLESSCCLADLWVCLSVCLSVGHSVGLSGR